MQVLSRIHDVAENSIRFRVELDRDLKPRMKPKVSFRSRSAAARRHTEHRLFVVGSGRVRCSKCSGVPALLLLLLPLLLLLLLPLLLHCTTTVITKPMQCSAGFGPDVPARTKEGPRGAPTRRTCRRELKDSPSCGVGLAGVLAEGMEELEA